MQEKNIIVMNLERAAIKKYNSHRRIIARPILCHAPFSNINFAQNGDMTVCCYNRTEVLGRYPTNSIQEAWESPIAGELRHYMKQKYLGIGCANCKDQIISGNIQGTKAIYYDKNASLRHLLPAYTAPPKVFEFEISNICNLECIMCNGYFSSAIRANREKLPKIHSPYDAAFIDEVKKFLPYLTDAKFLGGEPFLIGQYYDIWNAIIAINPSIKVHITTNGTVLNKKAQDILEKIDAGIIISVDSLDKENYERIRINGDFDILMENIQWFINYRNRKKSFLSFAVCPMLSNRKHLTEVIQFCIRHDINIHYNTVRDPENETLKNATPHILNELIADIVNIKHSHSPIGKNNKERTFDFLSHLKVWLNNSTEKECTIRIFYNQLKKTEPAVGVSANGLKMLGRILSYYEQSLTNNTFAILTDGSLEKTLEKLSKEMGNYSFWLALIDCFEIGGIATNTPDVHDAIKEKANWMRAVLKTSVAYPERLMRDFDFIKKTSNFSSISLPELQKSFDYIVDNK